jgi:DNA processing protein
VADVTVVVRAPLTSGALVTARHSFELGRPVLAVPGRPDDSMSAGCHELLRRGGRVCTGPSDLLDALGSGRLTLDAPRPAEVASGAAPQEPDLRAIYEQIRRDGTAVDTLVLVTGLAPAQLGERLIELELDGWVERRGPAVFRAVHRS